jgi:hypothetical protein
MVLPHPAGGERNQRKPAASNHPHAGSESAPARAIGRDHKGKVSPVLYVAGILFSFLDTRIADAIYVLVALMWLIPDRRIERAIRRL